MSKLIKFPGTIKPALVDWSAIEQIRSVRFPRVPKRALAVLKEIIELKALNAIEAWLLVDDTGEGYPPNPISIRPKREDIVWLIDLLDRFGGELAFGDLHCVIRRKKKRYPVFALSEVPIETIKGLHASFEFYEHFILTPEYRLLGKELPGVDLIAVVIERRESNESDFIGLMDATTAGLIFDRIEVGLSIRHLFEFAGLSVV